MVSLWGSKNGESNQNGDDRDHEQDGEGSRPSSRQPPGRSSHEADERTQLLPPGRGGFLDPDDPAVSLINTPALQLTNTAS